ncbi:COP9 signalosome complex subunit 7-like [Hibiscus syriacus]|uniref:COP9 signalosome complex subunit 7-like n=1 Tax=Hibiscus syriacus TaxID=106335 RepID=A0A6A2ZC99_HIBSY|nr:COP9 signalosome complex subunit 7-like [Hibiscus syriacus]
MRSKTAIINDEGTHFDNRLIAKALQKYGVRHKIATAYHPQTNRQAEVSNREVKQILENVVNPRRKEWSPKLDEALWAYRTTFKTPLGMSPFKMVYGKDCHLPVELEHKAYWVIKKLNFDAQLNGEKRLLNLNEMEEFRAQAYENAKFYKEQTKKWHEKNLLPVLKMCRVRGSVKSRKDKHPYTTLSLYQAFRHLRVNPKVPIRPLYDLTKLLLHNWTVEREGKKGPSLEEMKFPKATPPPIIVDYYHLLPSSFSVFNINAIDETRVKAEQRPVGEPRQKAHAYSDYASREAQHVGAVKKVPGDTPTERQRRNDDLLDDLEEHSPHVRREAGLRRSDLKSSLKINVDGGYDSLRREVEIRACNFSSPISFTVKLKLTLNETGKPLRRELKSLICGHDILRLGVKIVDGPSIVKLSLYLNILRREVEIQVFLYAPILEVFSDSQLSWSPSYCAMPYQGIGAIASAVQFFIFEPPFQVFNSNPPLVSRRYSEFTS